MFIRLALAVICHHSPIILSLATSGNSDAVGVLCGVRRDFLVSWVFPILTVGLCCMVVLFGAVLCFSTFVRRLLVSLLTRFHLCC